MANVFDRFSQQRIAERPVMPFPKPPDELKQRPDYERAYNQWHGQIELWRKTLDDRLAEIKTLAAQIDDLDSSVETMSTESDLDEFKQWVNQQLAAINTSITNLQVLIDAIEIPEAGEEAEESGFEKAMMLMGG